MTIPAFNPQAEIEQICAFIRDYYEKNHLKGAVLGISGGKDSAVAAALFARAIGKENVVGLTLPCHSNPQDRTDAELVAQAFGIALMNLDLTGAFDAFTAEVGKLGLAAPGTDETRNADINLKPRLRMAACYYMAALLSAVRGGTYLVAGTSNACELYVGYFTKGGDSVHDISVLARFTVDEVIAIGEARGVPGQVIHKAPSDGLSGMTDEEKMGVKYRDIGDVIQHRPVSQEAYEAIEKLHRGAAHKFHIPVYERDER